MRIGGCLIQRVEKHIVHVVALLWPSFGIPPRDEEVVAGEPLALFFEGSRGAI